MADAKTFADIVDESRRRNAENAMSARDLYDKWCVEKSCLTCGESWNGGANCPHGVWCENGERWTKIPYEVFLHYGKERRESCRDTAEQGNCCKKGNGWISVEERLPAEWRDVIVHHEGGKIEIEWRSKNNRSFLYEKLYGKVTHWMPLPKPPKEEEV